MSNGTKTADWLAILKMLGTALAPMIQAYAEARRLAKQDGVSAADLAAADARWTKNYTDPLAGETDPPPPPPPPPIESAPYLTAQQPPVPDDAELKARGYKVGDQVCGENEFTEDWMIVKKGMSRGGVPLIRAIS